MHSSVEFNAVHRVGTVLGRRWTLDRVIGIGGTAAVYSATHRNGSRAAIKVLHASFQTDPEMRRRLLRESYIANRIGVPGVVKILDDDVDGEIAFLVMELLVGASIETIRKHAGGRLVAADVVDIGCRLSEVLEAAHARGVLHRDIKPGNLFRTVDPVGLKLLDFGIARITAGGPNLDDTIVGNEGFVGTPVFMAPEQAHQQRQELDERTDLWAVGATLFTLLTGEYVNPGDTITEVLRSARERKVLALSEQLRDICVDLASVVERSLSFEPGARFQSASQMSDALKECRASLAARGEASSFFASQVRLGEPVDHAEERGSVRRREAKRAILGWTSVEPKAGFWSGQVGRLWWFHYTGPCTEETWRQYLELVQRMLASGREATLACFAHRAGPPNPIQRKQLADFVAMNRNDLARLDRFALIIDSLVHRGAITAINWLVKKPFEERVFNSPVAAIRWLTELHRDLDPDAVRAAIASQVPRDSLWTVMGSDTSETAQRPTPH